MSRPKDDHLAPQYRAIDLIVERVLKTRNSLFTPGQPIWSEAIVQDLYHRFVEHLDTSNNSFEAKFKKQLAGAPPTTVQLAGELLYVHLLAGNSTGGTHKRKIINTVLGWSASPVPIPPELNEALDEGLAAEGMAFKIYRPFLLQYLLEFVRVWWNLTAAERANALSDPWAFKQIAFAAIVPKSQSQAEILLHLVHPDTFEHIMSRHHKQRIAEGLAEGEETEIADIDRRLLAIRERLTPEHGADFSFYSSDLVDRWNPDDQELPDGPELPKNETVTASEISSTTRFWKVAPGEDAHFWNECLHGGYVCIGWEGLGDVKDLEWDDFKARQRKLLKKFSDWSERGSDQVWRFAHEIKKGDRVVANHGFFEVLGIGEVTGDYYFVPGANFGHRIPVRWYDTIPRKVEQRGWRTTMVEMDRKTFDQITKAPADTKVAKDLREDPLADLLIRRKNAVFYGPPGTGKTLATIKLAEKWRRRYGHDSVLQVTFHPTFAYEDFVEGFRPNDAGRFVRRDGIFVTACDRAHANRDRQFLLIIDELNRGDVARLFGELITLIEPDKRYAGVSRKLPYSQRELWVPPNVHLLGTMNTADRSISLLDVAIRRRFCFVEFNPDSDVVRDSSKHHHAVEGASLGDLMDAINRRLLGVGVDRDRAIGHSHFLIPFEEERPLDVLRERFRYDIIPLVEEYCYANRSLMRQVFGGLVDAAGMADGDVLEDDDAFVDALEQIATTGGGTDPDDLGVPGSGT